MVTASLIIHRFGYLCVFAASKIFHMGSNELKNLEEVKCKGIIKITLNSCLSMFIFKFPEVEK